MEKLFRAWDVIQPGPRWWLMYQIGSSFSSYFWKDFIRFSRCLITALFKSPKATPEKTRTPSFNRKFGSPWIGFSMIYCPLSSIWIWEPGSRLKSSRSFLGKTILPKRSIVVSILPPKAIMSIMNWQINMPIAIFQPHKRIGEKAGKLRSPAY